MKQNITVEQFEKYMIQNACFECGKKYGTKKEKFAIGVWYAECDICHKKNVPCADAQHDFGIYLNERERLADKEQDRI